LGEHSLKKGADKHSTISKLTKLGLTLILLLVFFSAFSVFRFEVSAEDTVLSLQPQASRIVGSGVEFQVNLTIASVVDLYGWQVKLYYNPALLNGTALAEGPFLKNAGTTYFLGTLNNSYSPTQGLVTMGCSLVGNVSGVTGSEVLATITFRTKTLGSCLLIPSETKLGNPAGGAISHIVLYGAVDVVPPVRNVAVEGVTLARNEVGEGRTVEVTVVVADTGDKTENFTVNLYANGTLFGTLDVVNLIAGTQRSLSYIWNTTGLPLNSSYQVRAEATPVPDEADLSDNVYVDGFLKITQGKHDIAVTRIVPQYTTVFEGRKDNITVTVVNRGDFSETFNVTVYYDDFQLGNTVISNFPYGERRDIIFAWDTSGVHSNQSYTLRAVCSTVPGETNLQDNTLVDGSITIVPRPSRIIDISDVRPSNQFGQPVSGFTRGSMAYFRVTINSSSVIPEQLLLTVNVYDANNLSIAVISFRGFIAPGSATFILGSAIPSTANIGSGIVYADALTDWPHLGGTPYCPEKSATFQINRP
jgi:hypothetical protein